VAVTLRIPGLVLVEHEFEVPLDHSRPDGERITVFAREVADPDGRERPFLVFLQGGPGFEAARPTGTPSGPAWLSRALQDYRVLLLDQRGTGRSTPVGTLPGRTSEEQAEYLTHFRADSIVRDAELIRAELGVDRWSVLGQSFGGFCTLAYLSHAPGSLREAFFTGGLPPVGRPVDDIYRATFDRLLERNRRYYLRYPNDRDRVLALHDRLTSEDVRLPSGDRLTWRRFRQLGNMLGVGDGAEKLHYLVELPADSPLFLHDVESSLPFTARNPLYTAVHESSYADGVATLWSADRVRPAEYDERPELLTGEHVFPWLFEDCAGLAPLGGAANILAEHPWPRLYDADVLRANEVPCAAAVYADDAFVERVYSEETAGLVGGLRMWLTNEYEHNALRVDGGRVLDRLIDMARSRR
jgi:pimeloyl-ACP methyl ester carboxylesterase